MKICMIVQDKMVKGGIAAVVNGYRGSALEVNHEIIYVESYKDGGKITKLLKGISGYCHFAKVLLLNRPELVHIHSSFGPSFFRKLPFIYMASWAKLPIINHIHGADFDEFYTNAGQKKKDLIRKAYGKCSVLIALSEEWKERLSQIVSKDKIEIVENYSILHEDALAERLNRPCNKKVLFLGEIGRRKGCFDIPAIAEKVIEVIPNAKFILCGAGTETDMQAIQSALRDRKIDQNVEFPGWVRDAKKDKVLRDADVFLLPSYNEGMPMSILDAMGYGLPIVSTNVGGIPKIVHDGENGACCQAGNIKRLSSGINELLLNDEYRHNAIKASYKCVYESYSLPKHLSQLETIYANYKKWVRQ